MERWRTVGISVQALSDLLYCDTLKEINKVAGLPANASVRLVWCL